MAIASRNLDMIGTQKIGIWKNLSGVDFFQKLHRIISGNLALGSERSDCD